MPERKVIKSSFNISILPNNFGFEWEAEDNPASPLPIKTKNFDRIIIRGVPHNIGIVYIDFKWSTYGTNINTGRHFQKRYILKVEE